MALSKNLTFAGRSFIETPVGRLDAGEKTVDMNAYIKVERVNASKDSASMDVSFTEGEKKTSSSYTFKPDLGGGNFIEQAYNHLKTLPEFVGAVDC
jgi:hypothetical protein